MSISTIKTNINLLKAKKAQISTDSSKKEYFTMIGGELKYMNTTQYVIEIEKVIIKLRNQMRGGITI